MPTGIDSNVDQWATQLAAILNGFGFHSPTAQGPLGEEIVCGVAANISHRGLDERRGLNGEFDRNKSEYLEEKIRDYFESRPDVRTGQMLSTESVEGEQEVSGDGKELVWKYGTGEAPASATRNRDRTTTDRQKAEWAHEGPSGNNDRPFFGVLPEDEPQIHDLAEEALDRHLKSR